MRLDWLTDPARERAALSGADPHALTAACALMAAAEGADPPGIRARLDGLGDPRAFDDTLERLRGDAAVADEEALAAVRVAKGDVEEAKRVARGCCALATADGDLSPAQADTARRVCEALNLSPTQFGL